MTELNPRGKAIIFSAPSGSGKTTIVRALLNEGLPLEFSISATSRSPRGKEVNGKDYHFLGLDGFREKIDQDALLEWEEVYENQFYGTLKSETDRIWNDGKAVLFDVDAYGGISLKNLLGDKALALFILPPSLTTLQQRLLDRNTETEEMIAIRLAKAKEEMHQREAFDAVIVNDQLDEAVAEARRHILDFLTA